EIDAQAPEEIWLSICDFTMPPRVILESNIGIVLADGETTGRRIRLNRPGDESAKCKGSRTWGPPKDFTQSTARSTIHSMPNATSLLRSSNSSREEQDP